MYRGEWEDKGTNFKRLPSDILWQFGNQKENNVLNWNKVFFLMYDSSDIPKGKSHYEACKKAVHMLSEEEWIYWIFLVNFDK